jgi:hypothetical protein
VVSIAMGLIGGTLNASMGKTDGPRAMEESNKGDQKRASNGAGCAASFLRKTKRDARSRPIPDPRLAGAVMLHNAFHTCFGKWGAVALDSRPYAYWWSSFNYFFDSIEQSLSNY